MRDQPESEPTSESESESDPDPDPDPTPDADPDRLRDHYRRAEPAIRSVAALPDGAEALGNCDFTGWYVHTGPKRARPYLLGSDYPSIALNVDRTAYASITYYDPATVDARPFAMDGPRRVWYDDEDPMPDYPNIRAIALFADIDLASDVKERPLSADRSETVEAALRHYVDAFAALVGSRDAVFVLDSVGGAYVHLAPAVTAPIAEHFDGDDRGRLFDELCDRMNRWLDETAETVNRAVPAAAGVFEPDLLNNKNRVYKAPLSVHSSIDGVVTPIDIDTDPAAIAYDVTPIDAVSDDLIADVTAWGTAFTADRHHDHIDALIGSLWPGYAETADGWVDALTDWLADERARDADREAIERAGAARRADRDTDPSDMAATGAIVDVFDAIDALDCRDVARDVLPAYDGAYDTDPGRTPPRFCPPPRWRTSDSGTSCFAARDGFVDLNEGNTRRGPVHLIARCEGIIDRCDAPLRGADWWTAVDLLRDRGYDIPTFDPPAPTVVLPSKVRDLSGETVGRPSFTFADVQTELSTVRHNALLGPGGTIVDGIPGIGKTDGVAADVRRYVDLPGGEPVTYVTVRGNVEQYGKVQQQCQDAGLSVAIAPGFHRDCDTMQGEHGRDARDRLAAAYANGVPADAIHRYLDPPCCADGRTCPYDAKWDRITDEDREPDVIIGHPAHLHVPTLTIGRTVVIDEFDSDAFVTTLAGDRLQRAINHWIDRDPDFPLRSYHEAIAADGGDRTAAAAYLRQVHDVDDPDAHPTAADVRDLADAGPGNGHAKAARALYTILVGADHPDETDPVDLANAGVGRYDPTTADGVAAVTLHEPPSLYTTTVVAMDGTPTDAAWNGLFGDQITFRREPVLTTRERQRFVTEVQPRTIVQTTDSVANWTREENVTVADARAVLRDVTDREGRTPAVITTLAACRALERAGVWSLQWVDVHGTATTVDDATARPTGEVIDGPASRVGYYGNIRGSSWLADEDLLVVLGSVHHGPDVVDRLGARIGEGPFEPTFPGPANDFAPTTYDDPIGQALHRLATEHPTTQAILRAGRNPDGATVYVHTDRYADWLHDLAHQGTVLHSETPAEHAVNQAIRDLAGDDLTDAFRTSDVAHRTGYTRERCWQIMRDHPKLTAAMRGIPGGGSGFDWIPADDVTDAGDLSLDAVDVPVLDAEEIREIAPITDYTLDVTNPTIPPPSASADPDEHADRVGKWGDLVPDTGAPPPGTAD